MLASCIGDVVTSFCPYLFHCSFPVSSLQSKIKIKQTRSKNKQEAFNLQLDKSLFMDSLSILLLECKHTYTHMNSGLNKSYVQKAGGYSRVINS